MEVHLLGPVQISCDCAIINTGVRKQRFVLATLALEVNHAVSTDRLIDLLWQDSPPQTARSIVHSHISGLRAILNAVGAVHYGISVRREGASYQLLCNPWQIDAHRFRMLMDRATAERDQEHRLGLLNEATSLWRGPAMVDTVDEPVRSALCGHLDAMRLNALEQRLQILVRLGRHDEAIGELTRLTGEHPDRHRLTELLMTALHHTGRSGEALALYRDLKRRLAEELGLDPPPQLQHIELAILRNEPPTHPPSGSRASVPAQLPPDLPWFTGREPDLGYLGALLTHVDDKVAATIVIASVCGAGGVGKTAFAVHAAHRLAGRFADGQIFIDLHGFTLGVAKVEPADALDRLLRAIGVSGERIPPGLDERTALWRSQLAGRRMLIILDNAATEAQVAPLLPNAAGCLVLVTSRRQLAGLDVTGTLPLDILPQAEATLLFIRAAGRSDISASTREVLEAVELCGRLPLAIRIAAARLKHRPAWTIFDLVERLRDLDTRLAALDDGYRSVRSTLQLSYQQLSDDAQRLYRLLGLNPGPDVSIWAANALMGGRLDQIRRLLDELVNNHILTESHLDRFRFHDLVRAHAVDTAGREEAAGGQQAALRRLLDHYRHTAAAAMDVAYPYERQRRPSVTSAVTPCPDLSHPNHAYRWLDFELPNLLAAAEHAAKYGWAEHVWQLPAILDLHLRIRGRYRDAQTLHQRALDHVRDLSSHEAQVTSLNGLGHVHRRLGRPERAGDYYAEAMQIARAIGDHGGELNALTGLGYVDQVLGQYERAGNHYREALQIARFIGDRGGEREALHGLGDVHLMLGRYDQADAHFERALQIAKAISDRGGELQALNSLGSIQRMLGHSEQASERYKLALRVAQSMGDYSGELQALTGLGHASRMLGLYEQAARCYQRVLHRARELGSGNWQFEALQGLGRMHQATNSPKLALMHHLLALQHAKDLAQAPDQARAHDGVAHAYFALNEPDQAQRHWRHGLDILVGLGTEQSDDLEASAPKIRAHLTSLTNTTIL